MCSEDFPKGVVQKVGSRVVSCYPEPAASIDLQGESSFAVLGNALGYVDRQVVLLDCVEDPDLLSAGGDDGTGVADLASHLGIERSLVENQLEHCLVLLLHGTLLQEADFLKFEAVVAEEGFFLSIVIDCPVAELVGCGIPGPLFLLLELDIEAVHVDGIAVLSCNQAGKVDRETIGVIKDKGIGAGNGLGSGILGHVVIHHPYTAVKGPEE